MKNHREAKKKERVDCLFSLREAYSCPAKNTQALWDRRMEDAPQKIVLHTKGTQMPMVLTL